MFSLIFFPSLGWQSQQQQQPNKDIKQWLPTTKTASVRIKRTSRSKADHDANR